MPARVEKIDDMLDQFVRDLHVRTKATSYRCALRKFHDSLGKNGWNDLNQSALRRWLRAQLTDTPVRWVVHRAQLVTRFLDWLAEQKIIPVNPFAELRQKIRVPFNGRDCTRSLSANPSKALEALRPPPRYGSHLGSVMRDHIQRMRSLGYHYGHESEFLRFDRFLQARPDAAAEPLSKLIREHAAAAGSPALKLRRLRLGNIVAKALTRNGIATPSIVPDRLLIRDVARKRAVLLYTATSRSSCCLRRRGLIPVAGAIATANAVHDVGRGILRRTSSCRDRRPATPGH